MKLSRLVETSGRIASTRSRLEKAAFLGELFAELEADEIAVAVSYLSGSMPQGRIGVGWSFVRAARPDASATEPRLELVEVDARLEAIAGVTGKGSNQTRKELLTELFSEATEKEQDFLSRLLLGDLRQGALVGLVIDAVARAAGIPLAEVRRALMLSGDIGAVTRAALTRGEAGLSEFRLELFRPLQPMLAQTAEDVAEALDTLGRAGLEFKLDGARIQVHQRGEDVRIFTRRLNEVTEACPEVVEAIRAVGMESSVLDGEVIALKKDGRPHAFQTTMRRFGRRLDVAAMRKSLPLSSFYFDCLHLDGESLIDLPAEERFRRLRGVLPRELLIPRLVTEDREEAAAFVDQALAAGHEGVMAKALDAPYEAGSRGKSWLKVKSAHTLDLVVLAAEWGSGRREGWLSNLHLGARDPESGGFVMLGKTFKGMTDEILRWQTERLQEIETERDEHVVRVRPELVVEVAFNDLQKSPHYPGGLALRFARLKAYREDKAVEDADAIETVRAIFRAQGGELEEEKDSERGKQLRLFD